MSAAFGRRRGRASFTSEQTAAGELRALATRSAHCARRVRCPSYSPAAAIPAAAPTGAARAAGAAGVDTRRTTSAPRHGWAGQLDLDPVIPRFSFALPSCEDLPNIHRNLAHSPHAPARAASHKHTNVPALPVARSSTADPAPPLLTTPSRAPPALPLRPRPHTRTTPDHAHLFPLFPTSHFIRSY